MSEEEKKAIENLRFNTTNNGFFLYDGTTNIFRLRDIQTILNLIEKQEKVIDEMTDAIVGDKKILALICKKIINKTEIECDEQNLLCDDCIKQYFYRKVENINEC